MENTNDNKWKYPLIKQQKAQIIRILRPKEVSALIDKVDLNNETTWIKGRKDHETLKDLGFTKKDLQIWFKFFLYSGTRFSEGVFIHDYRDPNGNTLYHDDGTLWLPRYKGKKLRSIQTRTIYFSYKGREIMDDFFNTPQLPHSNEEDTKLTLIDLTQILHKAGTEIGLPEITLDVSIKKTIKDKDGNIIKELKPINQFKQNPDGTYSKLMKEKPKTEIIEKKITTNGCAFRSLRKTWESWLTAYYGNNPQMRERILFSQGHKKEIAMTHYLEISFDSDDIKDIGEEVKGFAVS